ncbi:MAG: dihydrolipoamide acetyltransferase family protein [Chthonomonadales bacterium]
MAEVRMPKMGDGMEEGTVLRWLKQVGDMVKANETIAEIETDKANVEMPAEETGVLSQILVNEGETVAVGAVIGFIGAGSASASAAPAPKAATPDISPVAPVATSHASTGPVGERVKASGLARKLAAQAGIDLAQIHGSGPGGRIVEKDIEAFKKSGTPQSTIPATAARPLATAAAPTLEGTDQDISKMRKAIARRTVQSKQTIPHFYLVIPIDMDRALNLLSEMNAQNPDQKVTVNDLIVKASAVALARIPEVNVSFTPDEKIRRYESINIGIAAVTDQGLAIPVVPDCGNLTLRQISVAAKALILKARSGTLSPAEMSGGTFSISNLGMFGIEEFLAIINPPESAMLAVGAATKEVVVLDDGSFAARSRMRVSLSCDHRTVDGVLGARWLQEFKGLLENPMNLLA